MKELLAVLLVGVACMELAQSLRCYTCEEPTDISECTTVSNCSETDTACMTTVLSVDSGYPFFGKITVTNSCVKTCVPSDPDGIGESHPNSCCYTDLCNTGRGPELKAGYSTVGITAATLWILLRVSL
ncbi:secreted Ly-6/uPAR-related protein 1-like [Emydura macquarii macquarii]|uniref:secreted Ly-6/uPAR-related protein 1-like n=1 Tax=Emydura macquarii macquarii TaxID=1129001 RepID=UPI00352B436B